MTATILVFATLIIMAASALWRGYVLSVVWGWFMVERFGLPPLSVAQAIGVALVGAAITHHYTPTVEGKGGEALADVVLAPLTILAIGWVARSFI